MSNTEAEQRLRAFLQQGSLAQPRQQSQNYRRASGACGSAGPGFASADCLELGPRQVGRSLSVLSGPNLRWPLLEHGIGKACPGSDPGWAPVFGKRSRELRLVVRMLPFTATDSKTCQSSSFAATPNSISLLALSNTPTRHLCP